MTLNVKNVKGYEKMPYCQVYVDVFQVMND